jgi:hypothetical protein
MATLFNDKLFAQEVFQQLVPMLTPINIFTSDISPNSGQKGDAVIVPLFGNTTTTTFTQSTTVWEQSGGAISAITVSLNYSDITPVDLTARQLAESAAASRFDAWAYQMASSHAERILGTIFAGITTGAFGTAIVTSAVASYGRNALAQTRKAMINRGRQSGRKTIVVNPDVEAAFLQDDKLTLALNRGSAATMTDGDLGRLYGYDIRVAPELGTNGVSLVGFAAGQNAMAIAFRQVGDFLPNDEYAAIERLVDSESGIGMLYTRHWSRAQGKWFMNMHSLFGFANAVTLDMGLLARSD